MFPAPEIVSTGAGYNFNLKTRDMKKKEFDFAREEKKAMLVNKVCCLEIDIDIAVATANVLVKHCMGKFKDLYEEPERLQDELLFIHKELIELGIKNADKPKAECSHEYYLELLWDYNKLLDNLI